MKRIENELMRVNILDTVIECKKEASGEDVSLSQIASRAGISERTLNRYFPDKEMLLYDAATRYLCSKYDCFAKQYRAAETAGMSGLERVLFLVHLQLECYKNDTINALVFVRAYNTALQTAVCKKLPISEFDAATREITLSCIDDGIKDGSIRKDVSALDSYLLISSNFNGLVQRLFYMYSIASSKEEHKSELFQVFTKYEQMLEEYLSAEGRRTKT